MNPNPSNRLMLLHDCWLDLQHVRFYDRYRLGPEWALDAQPDLPVARRRARGAGRERMVGLAVPLSLIEQISDLKERLSGLSRWVSSLYAPGEYSVTGVR